MSGRPDPPSNVPSRRAQLDGDAISDEPLSRHHIIPFQVLSDFYNTAVQYNQFSSRLGGYIVDRLESIKAYFEDVLRLDLERRDIIFTPTVFEVAVNGKMHAAFAWMPGNLFYGPSPRRRGRFDPGNAFETESRWIIGDEAYDRLLEINNRMIEFTLNAKQQTEQTFERIMEGLDYINQEKFTMGL